MSGTIEFRLARGYDDVEPFYVRIAAADDGRALAFTEPDASEAPGDAAIAALRSGAVTHDTMHDRGNDVWFFRFKDASGEVLFRSMPCATEQEMREVIDRILAESPSAPLVDDRGQPT